MSNFTTIEATAEYKAGKQIELKAQEIINQVNNVTVVEHDGTEGRQNHAHYDFKTSDNITYEVKGDSKSIRTGNFFITVCQQINNEWRDAGIETTKADYHMLLYGKSFYKVNTRTLKTLTTKKIKFAFYHNDRGNIVKGLLVPVEYVKPHATIYDFID